MIVYQFKARQSPQRRPCWGCNNLKLMKNIEVEFRAKMSLAKYRWLNNFLIKNASDLGEDNKETRFYILPDKLFKVVNEVSKKRAKIALKDSRIGSGSSRRELEIEIKPSNYKKAIKIFDGLNLPGKKMKAWQDRHNYLYRGVEIAVKHSDYWGYHAEMEVMVNNNTDKEEIEKKIKKIAKDLGLKLMDIREIKKFTDSVEKKLK